MSNILNINNNNAGWNYSDPQKPGYMPSIQGTVVEINEVQARNYMTKQPEFWPDGKPKLNIEFVIQGQSGRELPWVFGPKSTAADAVKKALLAMNPNATSMADVGGYLVKVTTHDGQWGQGRPRPWEFEILGLGQVPFRGVKEYEAPAQPQPQAQQPAAQQGQPPMQNGYFAPPVPEPQAAQPQQQAQQGQQQPNAVGFDQTTGGVVYDQDIPF